MTHGFDAASDSVEPAAKPAGAAAPVLAAINRVVVILSSIALVIASIVLTYSVFSRYFFHFSTDWQDELSVFLIVGALATWILLRPQYAPKVVEDKVAMAG